MTVEFKSLTDTPSVSGFWQYDYGVTLTITGLVDLPAAPVVHFAISGQTSAEPRIGVYADGVLTVAVPDAMLAQNKMFYGYIYVANATYGYTVARFKCNVEPRARPSDAATPDEVTAINQVVAQLNALLVDTAAMNDTATASAADAARSAASAAESAESLVEATAAMVDASQALEDSFKYTAEEW
jgi:hypothetical protein